jgi:hypothetical protein
VDDDGEFVLGDGSHRVEDRKFRHGTESRHRFVRRGRVTRCVDADRRLSGEHTPDGVTVVTRVGPDAFFPLLQATSMVDFARL